MTMLSETHHTQLCDTFRNDSVIEKALSDYKTALRAMAQEHPEEFPSNIFQKVAVISSTDHGTGEATLRLVISLSANFSEEDVIPFLWVEYNVAGQIIILDHETVEPEGPTTPRLTDLIHVFECSEDFAAFLATIRGEEKLHHRFIPLQQIQKEWRL